MIRTDSYLFFAVLLTTGGFLHAQSHGIRGTIQDPQHKPIDGAEVLLFREGGASALARTNSTQGTFAFQQSLSGSDWLEVSATGFRKATVPVATNEPLTIQLEVGGLDQHVLVTAEASAQNVDQISKAATVIDAAEIAQRNEYSRSETLRETPGLLVRILGGPGQSTTVRMRGLRADATAILIDGLRFRDIATTQADASSFLSTFNVINFDRVEVLRGSGSSLYGTNAVGGTINIVTDPGGGKHHGEVQTEGGTLGLLRGRATASGSFHDNRLTYSAGLLHLNVLSGVDGDDRARSTGLQNFLRYAVGPRTSLSSRIFFSDDFVQPNLSPTTSGIPAANIPNIVIVPAIPLAPDQLLKSTAGLPIVAGDATYIPSRDDADNRRASRFWSGAVIAHHSFTPAVDLQASYQRVHTNRIFENGPAGAGTQPSVSNFSQFCGDVDTADSRLYWRAAQWMSLSGGYEFEHEGYLNVDNNNLPAPGTVSTRTEAAQRSQTAYFAMQNTLAKQRLQVSVSGRAQSFSLDHVDPESPGRLL